MTACFFNKESRKKKMYKRSRASLQRFLNFIKYDTERPWRSQEIRKGQRRNLQNILEAEILRCFSRRGKLPV